MAGPLQTTQLFGGSAEPFYNEAITSSLRFPEQNGGGYLSRTFDHNNSSSDWTFSTWLKRGQIGNFQVLFSSTSQGNPYYQSALTIDGNDKVYYYHGSNANSGGGTHNNFTSSNVLKDTASWYHIVVQRDNDGNTIMYVNGTQYGSGSSSSNLRYINGTTYPHYIGNYTYQSNPGGELHGYLAETIFVDGTLVAPTALAETKNGVWIPIKDPDLTYGENGFRLQYLQTGTSANASGIGADTSGNNHHFTVTTLTAHDVVPDNPENNFSNMNPLVRTNGADQSDFSEGNLKLTKTGTTYSYYQSTFGVKTGKWYAEIRCNAKTSPHFMIGIAEMNLETYMTGDSVDPHTTAGSIWYSDNGYGHLDGTGVATGTFSNDTGFAEGQIVGIALDLDSATRTVQFYVDGSLVTTQNLTSNFKDHIGFACNWYNSQTGVWNFGQDSSFAGAETATSNSDGNGNGTFHTSVPSGYLALCTANLSEPTIGPNSNTLSTDVFNTLLYTGNTSSTRAITGVGFKPDWVWFAQRNNTSGRVTYDSSRGVNKMLRTDGSGAEDDSSQYGYLSVFGDDGFTAQAGSTNNNYINENNVNIVAWNWKANGGTTTSVSESGNNPANVRQTNATAGFSIITYTGTGAAGTIAHGLGVAPKVIITKRRGASGNWASYFGTDEVSDPETDAIYLDLTDARTDSADFWNDTAPTSTVYSVQDAGDTNANDATYVAYVFAEVEGYSKIGSYTGNGNNDGAFVYTGFTPAWILIKKTSATDNWEILDNKRNTYNQADLGIYANTTDQEASSRGGDLISNGFKARNGNGNTNESGNKYVYMAFAEHPLKYANAR